MSDGTFVGYDGYIPGPMDALVQKRLSGEISDEEFEAELAKVVDSEWEYVRGHRWVDREGGEHWFVQAGTIAPGYLEKYIAEGGGVIRRKVGPWEVVSEER
jgi:hypothetical protein